MNRQHFTELLGPFVDGELDAGQIAEVQDGLRQFPDGQAELDELTATRALAREAFLAPVEGVDLSGVFDGVMARMAAEDAVAAADTADAAEIDGVPILREAPTGGGRGGVTLFGWFKSILTFEQPALAFAAALVIGTLAAVVWLTNQPDAPVDGGQPAPLVAEDDAPKIEQGGPKGERRGREAEGRYASTEAYLDGAPEVAVGTARVEFDDDPETPLVVWHEIEGEGEGPEGSPGTEEQGL